MGAIPPKKPANQPCLQPTDLQAWLKTRVCLSALLLEPPWANTMEPFPAGSLFPLNHITGEQGWQGLGRQWLHPFSCPGAELAASKWLQMTRPCLCPEPGLGDLGRAAQYVGEPKSPMLLSSAHTAPSPQRGLDGDQCRPRSKKQKGRKREMPQTLISAFLSKESLFLANFGCTISSPQEPRCSWGDQASWSHEASQSQAETPKPAWWGVYISSRA